MTNPTGSWAARHVPDKLGLQQNTVWSWSPQCGSGRSLWDALGLSILAAECNCFTVPPGMEERGNKSGFRVCLERAGEIILLQYTSLPVLAAHSSCSIPASLRASLAENRDLGGSVGAFAPLPEGKVVVTVLEVSPDLTKKTSPCTCFAQLLGSGCDSMAVLSPFF